MTDQPQDPQARIAELERQLAEARAQLARNITGGGDWTDVVAITGDQNVVYGSVETLTIRSVLFLTPPPPGQTDPRDLLLAYLNRVIRQTGSVNLAGIDRYAVSKQDDAALDLAAIYTALDTVRSVMTEEDLHDDEAMRPDQRRQSALAFAAAAPHAAMLGDPGSGKTTFANFLTLCHAGELLGLAQANLSTLGEEWTGDALMPLYVVLRDFAAQIDDGQDPGERLWRFIKRSLGDVLTEFTPLLRKHLIKEGGLLILDGLDEAPEADHRRDAVKQAVLDFREQFPKVRILLTSRTYAYQSQEWQLPGFDDAVLASFNREQIDRFVDRWYAHMAARRANLSETEAQGRAVLLKDALRRHRYLADLAPRPLLLTLMASLHAWRGGSLPDDREQLYDESVDLLLDLWERPKWVLDQAGKPTLQSKSAAEWLDCPQAEIRAALEKLAYEVHAGQQGTTGTADIDEDKLVGALRRAANNPDLRPDQVLAYIRDRAGLLINRGEGVYAFPHRTFQEYMAARYLTRTGFPNQVVKLLREDVERWREVLLLVGARSARTPYAAWSLVGRLCATHCDADAAAACDDGGWWMALLAGQLLAETGIHEGLDPVDDAADAETLAKVRGWLAALVDGGRLPPADRAGAGRSLGRLGDPRPGVAVRDGAPDIAWVPVAAAPFPMGGDGPWDGGPEFECRLVTEDFCIARYPVTVAQYEAFREDRGYRNPAYWPEAAAAGLWQDGQLTVRTWDRERREYFEEQAVGPAWYGPLFDGSNQPQVGVSWYEALAFCRWLSTRIDQPIRLPTEAEWELAARHTDGRIYPWGNDFDPLRANMSETGVGATSPVGMFPGGAAVCDACDMAGNVWEWCSTKWTEDYRAYGDRADDDLAGTDRRVVRGGSFLDDRYLVRCAARLRNYPAYRDLNWGFRVVGPPGLCDADR